MTPASSPCRRHPVIDAARLMLEKRISGMPVVEWRRPAGRRVFTEGDLLRRTAESENRPSKRRMDRVPVRPDAG